MVTEKAACLGERVKEMALERMIIVATLKGRSNCVQVKTTAIHGESKT